MKFFTPKLAHHTLAAVRLMLFVLLAGLGACSGQSSGKGIVAEVNGVPIYYVEMDALRNTLFAGMSGDGTPPDDSILREQYAYALKQLILHELVNQYLVSHKITVDDTQLVKEEVIIQSDYAAGSFREVLLADGISPDIWHKMMMNRVRMQAFVSHVLRPSISISAAEVEAYYKGHKEEFLVPEQWHFLQISGQDELQVTEARDVFLATQDASSIQGDQSLIVRDIRMSKDRLPEEALKGLGSLGFMQPGPVKESDGAYKTYIVLEILKPTVLDAGETYKRVEHILAEAKIQSILDSWFQVALKKAKIRIASKLLSPEIISMTNATMPFPNIAGGFNATGIDGLDESALVEP